ncbi:unnamed protein product [Allacma fusca]|uniref:Uncharacterized protein n=1 Tax=Allacma fusca TaxID=39272 RepID=A0A8J2L6H6_9HEXA|nr:unnamed protein product [Allacma fusca]
MRRKGKDELDKQEFLVWIRHVSAMQSVNQQPIEGAKQLLVIKNPTAKVQSGGNLSNTKVQRVMFNRLLQNMMSYRRKKFEYV